MENIFVKGGCKKFPSVFYFPSFLWGCSQLPAFSSGCRPFLVRPLSQPEQQLQLASPSRSLPMLQQLARTPTLPLSSVASEPHLRSLLPTRWHPYPLPLSLCEVKSSQSFMVSMQYLFMHAVDMYRYVDVHVPLCECGHQNP